MPAMTALRERRLLALLTLAAAALGIGLRCWHIFAEPLWLDEAYSAYAAGKSLSFLWHVVPRYETHPPFYYTLLHFWEALFGDSLAALRCLGLAAGLATVSLVAWNAAALGRLLGWPDRRRVRLVCAAFILACMSIPLVEMTREVRPYPVMIAVYACAVRALLAICATGLRRTAYLAYLVCLALLLWLHNLGPLWDVALAIALAIALSNRLLTRRDWTWLAAGHLAVALLYLPALAILLDQAPTWVASTWLTFSWARLSERLANLYAVPGWQAISAITLAVLAVAALYRTHPRLLSMLSVLALVPVLLSLTLTVAIAPVFIVRTMTPVAVPALLLLATGVAAWRGLTGWIAAGAAFMLVANLIAVDIQARIRGPMQDWYAAVAWLQRHFRPGDRILAYPNEGALPLERALKDRKLAWTVEPIPGPIPANDPLGWHPTGSRGVISLPPARLHGIAMQPHVQATPTIWLLRLAAWTYDPGDVFLQEIATGRRVAGRYRQDAIDIAGYARSRSMPDRSRR
jgi:mannosyltransferase